MTGLPDCGWSFSSIFPPLSLDFLTQRREVLMSPVSWSQKADNRRWIPLGASVSCLKTCVTAPCVMCFDPAKERVIHFERNTTHTTMFIIPYPHVKMKLKKRTIWNKLRFKVTPTTRDTCAEALLPECPSYRLVLRMYVVCLYVVFANLTTHLSNTLISDRCHKLVRLLRWH